MPVPTASNDPAHSSAYGPIEDADQTRQAQHSQSNDTPTDVNLNAVVGRLQAANFARIGEEFQGSAARRTNMFDHMAALLAARTGMNVGNSTTPQ
jgi:hypothetical protein